MPHVCNWCRLPITEIPFVEMTAFANGKVERATMHTICVRGWEMENKKFLVPLSVSSKGWVDDDENDDLPGEGEDED